MASSSTATAQDNTRRENTDNNTSLERNNNQALPPTNPNPPPQAPYPNMGYPPPQGYYPGYPPQYSGYAGYPGYPYSQPPQTTAYYATTNRPQAPGSGSSFLRGIVMGLAFLVLLSLSMSIIVWLVLRPQVPRFQIDTLNVSNFNTATPQFRANWDANFTVTNTNQKLTAYFDAIQSVVFYNNEVLAMTLVPPIALEPEKQGLVQVKMSTDTSVSGSGMTSGESTSGRKINQEKNTGKVSFDIRFDIRATLKSGPWHIRRPDMRVYCENLEVVFGQGPVNGTIGTLKDKSQDCLVYA